MEFIKEKKNHNDEFFWNSDCGCYRIIMSLGYDDTAVYLPYYSINGSVSWANVCEGYGLFSAPKTLEDAIEVCEAHEHAMFLKVL